MNFQECRRFNLLFFKTHINAHEEVLSNEFWFGDGKPHLGKQFTARKAGERKAEIVELLFRSAKQQRGLGNTSVADQLEILADQTFYCRPRHRCGSLACTECLRAFQRAKVAAERVTIRQLKAERDRKLLVMANIIPLSITYTPAQLADLDVRKLNRWLKDTLTRAGLKRFMLGSIDFSWEGDRGIYQPHWHIAMFTSNRKKLLRKLKLLFPGLERGDRPVVVSKSYSLEFLPYKNKAIKIIELLKGNRRCLPYLLLALDRIDPLELMVLSGVRVSAQEGGLVFRKIPRR